MPDAVLPFYRHFYREYLAQYLLAERAKRVLLRTVRSLWLYRAAARYRLGVSKGRLLKPLDRFIERGPEPRRYKLRERRARFLGQVFHLVPMTNYKATHALPSKVIQPAKRERWSGPAFLGDRALMPRVPNQVEIEQPPIEITELYDAIPLAASGFILKDGIAIHHDYYSAERDVCMSERYGIVHVSPAKSELRYFHALPPIRMAEAISLLGESAGNYAHFLCEVLPRLTVIDQFDEYASLPILVDGWMNRNHFSALAMFNCRQRDIIRTGLHQPAHLGRLISVSPTAHAIPEYRSYVERGVVEYTPAIDYKFNAHALDLVRTAALGRRTPKYRRYSARLMLHRVAPPYGNGRNLVDMADITMAAELAGFDVIEPGTMPFEEQVLAFRNARVVVAPIGAAMANLIFTPRGCRVICLSPVYQKANYFYWSNFMNALGHELIFVIGPQVGDTHTHLMHRDYRIEIEDFYEAIADALQQPISPRLSRSM